MRFDWVWVCASTHPSKVSPHAREVASRKTTPTETEDAPEEESDAGQNPHHLLRDAPPVPRRGRRIDRCERDRNEAIPQLGLICAESPTDENATHQQQSDADQRRNAAIRRTHFSPPVLGSLRIRTHSNAKAPENMKV